MKIKASDLWDWCQARWFEESCAKCYKGLAELTTSVWIPIFKKIIA